MSNLMDSGGSASEQLELLLDAELGWHGSAGAKESTIHQLSPYIGKMKSSMARALVGACTKAGETVYDPFCGSGTVAFEAWRGGRNAIANDISPYAVALTRAKLRPPCSYAKGMLEIGDAAVAAGSVSRGVDLRRIPKWVRAFFHPETLREVVAWAEVLRKRKSDFLLACLLGILHHQRPGFLSYPSSHAVPYLREKKFPREEFPELYQRREVRERLERKLWRSLRRVPALDHGLERSCRLGDAVEYVPRRRVDAIITSPPYMSELDYGRDNRLRLWLLGVSDWRSLDSVASASEGGFLELMRTCLDVWRKVLRPGGVCVLVLGDRPCRSYGMSLGDTVAHLAMEEVGGYSLAWRHSELIPDERRVRRGHRGTLSESVIVFSREKGD